MSSAHTVASERDRASDTAMHPEPVPTSSTRGLPMPMTACVLRSLGFLAPAGNAVVVHWMRNALAHVPKGQHTMVAAAIRQAFCKPTLMRRIKVGGMSPTSSGRAGPSSPR